jgi:hypothetical protein
MMEIRVFHEADSEVIEDGCIPWQWPRRYGIAGSGRR